MIAELIPEEKRKLYELEQQVTRIERGDVDIHVSDVQFGLNEMSYRLDELDRLVQKEPKARRDDFRRRVQSLRNTFDHTRKTLDNTIRRRDRNRYETNRSELFAGAVQKDDSIGDIEAAVAESSSLERSGKMLNEYIAVGQETLLNLTSQRERLKGIQRKAFDILNSLGVANTLMRMVERRDSVDKWIVFGGMFVVLLFIAFVWFYLVK